MSTKKEQQQKFADRFPLEDRRKQSASLLKLHPTRVPVIVEKYEKALCPDIDKKKYLVQKEMKLSQFIHVIRRRIHLKDDQTLFLFVDEKPPQMSATLEQLYADYKKKHKKTDDGFLYIQYAEQESFGFSN